MSDTPIYSAQDLGISIATTLSKEAITVGDTFEYTVTISWESNNVVALIPKSSIYAKGISTVGVKQNSGRIVKDGKTVSKNEFVYKVAATDTGSTTIPELNFMVPVEGAHTIGLRTPPKDLHVDAPVNVLPGVVGTVVAFALVAAFIFRKRKHSALNAKKKAKATELDAIRDDMMNLKARLGAADSRDWVLSLEAVLKRFAMWKFDSDDLEALVKDGRMAGFAETVKLFSEARYGGGNRDQFENRETWKAAFRQMNLEE